MKSIQISLKTSGIMAYTRLREWFDPAFSGTPYETQSKHNRPVGHTRMPFYSKRLSIGV